MTDETNNASIYRQAPVEKPTYGDVSPITDWERQGYTSQEQMDREKSFYNAPSIRRRELDSRWEGGVGFNFFGKRFGVAEKLVTNLSGPEDFIKDGKRISGTLQDIYRTHGADTALEIARGNLGHIKRQQQDRNYHGRDYHDYVNKLSSFIERASDPTRKAMTKEERKSRDYLKSLYDVGSKTDDKTYKMAGITREEHIGQLRNIFKREQDWKKEGKKYKHLEIDTSKVQELEGKNIKEVLNKNRKTNLSARSMSVDAPAYKGKNRAGMNKIVKSNRMP